MICYLALPILKVDYKDNQELVLQLLPNFLP